MAKSNFEFLKAEWPSLFQKLQRAESRVNIEPVSTAAYCRLALEELVHLVYDLEQLDQPFNSDLFNLIRELERENILPGALIGGVHYVRKVGNNASHYGRNVYPNEALNSIKYLFTICKWFGLTYAQDQPTPPSHFNEYTIPAKNFKPRSIKAVELEAQKEQEKLLKQIELLRAEKLAILEKSKSSEQALQRYKAERELAKQKLTEQKANRSANLVFEFSEPQTRKHFTEIDLHEAGWDQLQVGKDIDVLISGMPISAKSPKGIGNADYVLWDKNELPLAVIEVKKTGSEPENGKLQAKLYADALEKKYGQRPVIYYSNGLKTFIWEDDIYPAPRRVYGYLTREELQWKMQQKKRRIDPRKGIANHKIVDRWYQKEALQKLTKNLVIDTPDGFNGLKRNQLISMASGSGKTRTAIAFADLLMQQNWVNKVLYLADNLALVSQAKANFTKFLPQHSTVNLDFETETDSTQIICASYECMLNKIDNVNQQGERFYGVGHFDLIIIDEAHSSLFKRYKSIFEYFDSLVLGQTSVPSKLIDQQTFEMFDCHNNQPSYSFDWNQAVSKYIVPFKNVTLQTELIRKGLHYHQHNQRDKELLEDSFEPITFGVHPEEITSSEMNKWLFNKDTVTKVLEAFMQEGLKINGGKKIGRSIIFAMNQKHANFIVKCFQERFPELPAGFMAVIRTNKSYVQNTIDSFCDPNQENLPQIAVSVDVLDTGIDAPRVLNLLFFKIVRSYAKFWQMIGRGARPCPNVYGEGKPKDHYLIFDVCQNFEFFDIPKNQQSLPPSKPLVQQLFLSRIDLLRQLSITDNIDNLSLAKNILAELHQQIKSLDRKQFQVEMDIDLVEHYSKKESWQNLNQHDIMRLKELSELFTEQPKNVSAVKFDLFIVKLQTALLNKTAATERLLNHLQEIAQALSRKNLIPEVVQHKELLSDLKKSSLHKDLSIADLENIRTSLRGVMNYLAPDNSFDFFTDFEDSEVDIERDK